MICFLFQNVLISICMLQEKIDVVIAQGVSIVSGSVHYWCCKWSFFFQLPIDGTYCCDDWSHFIPKCTLPSWWAPDLRVDWPEWSVGGWQSFFPQISRIIFGWTTMTEEKRETVTASFGMSWFWWPEVTTSWSGCRWGCWPAVCWWFLGFLGFLGLIGLLGFPGLPNEGDPEFFINRYRDYHRHHVNQAQLGCAPGIVRTKVGYGGGSTPSPSYRWKWWSCGEVNFRTMTRMILIAKVMIVLSTSRSMGDHTEIIQVQHLSSISFPHVLFQGDVCDAWKVTLWTSVRSFPQKRQSRFK